MGSEMRYVRRQLLKSGLLISSSVYFQQLHASANSGLFMSFRDRANVQAQCNLVELYPGYPDYEGYVTGVAGPGQGECLSDLERNNPNFDKSEVNRTNKRAAKSLGIDGLPD